MNLQTQQHSVFRSGIKKPSHQRNLTAVESLKFLNPNLVQAPQFISLFHPNTLISQRYSCFQTKDDLNTKFKSDFAFFKTKVSNCEISFGNQHLTKSKLKEKKPEGQKKVPRFIKERQLSKSEQTHQNISNLPQIKSLTYSQVDRSQNFNKADSAEKNWLGDLKQQNSFELDVGQSFGSLAVKKMIGNSKNLSMKTSIEQSQILKESTNEKQSFKSTQSTIKTLSHCVSEKNIFLPNLSKWEQQQIERDFKQLFSSRKIQKDEDLYKVDDDLAREFELILN